MNILSIQSHVAYGHVGNAAAVFPLQRLGHEVWPIHTVQFSNHTGYGAWRGEAFPAALIDACIEGIGERGVLGRCDAVLSGYVGTPETGAAILRAAARVKAANPAALYCCDPVIGDAGRGVFVKPGIAEFFADDALRLADLATPNMFELELLSGSKVSDRESLAAAFACFHTMGPPVVLVTSLILDDTPAGSLDLAVSDGAAIWRLRTPRLPVTANGAGDMIAALFLAHCLVSHSPHGAMEAAAASVFGVLRRTAETGARELALIAAQEEFVRASERFSAERIG